MQIKVKLKTEETLSGTRLRKRATPFPSSHGNSSATAVLTAKSLPSYYLLSLKQRWSGCHQHIISNFQSLNCLIVVSI